MKRGRTWNSIKMVHTWRRIFVGILLFFHTGNCHSTFTCHLHCRPWIPAVSARRHDHVAIIESFLLRGMEKQVFWLTYRMPCRRSQSIYLFHRSFHSDAPYGLEILCFLFYGISSLIFCSWEDFIIKKIGPFLFLWFHKICHFQV